MAQLFELMNQQLKSPDGQIKRFWIKSGCPVKLSRSVYICLYANRIDDNYKPEIVVVQGSKDNEQVTNLDLPENTWLDLIEVCGLMALPRATELSQDGVPKRILLEFVIVDQKLQWVV